MNGSSIAEKEALLCYNILHSSSIEWNYRFDLMMDIEEYSRTTDSSGLLVVGKGMRDLQLS